MSNLTKANNQLLSALPASAYLRISPLLETFQLIFKEIIFEPGDKITHIYFPQSGIISLLASVGENATLEVGIVGKEGMVGLPVYLGQKVSDTGRWPTPNKTDEIRIAMTKTEDFGEPSPF